MKKLVLIPLLLFALSLKSQKIRYVDLVVNILEKDTIWLKIPAKLPIAFSVKNLGPDTLYQEDSFMYTFGGYAEHPSRRFKLNNKLAPNETFIIKDTLFFGIIPGTDLGKGYIRLAFKSRPLAYKKVSIHGALSLLKDSFANSNDYITIKYNGSQNNIQSISKQNSINVYPNPCSNELYFNSLTKIKKITFYNYLGVKIKEISNLKENNVNIRNLNKGMYLVVIENENKIVESFKIQKI